MKQNESEKKEKKKEKNKLQIWKERLAESDFAYGGEVLRMAEREELYLGRRRLEPLTAEDRYLTDPTAPHRRNIVFENIETMVSSQIPLPKVTARHKEDEPLAQIIEHMLRCELDRMPFEEINDLAERIVPMQGGVGYLVEWDSTKSGADHSGELSVSLLHPSQLAPQPGVYTSVEDMDWIILKMPSTREDVRRKYGKSVSDGDGDVPNECEKDSGYAPDAVTVCIGYERREDGGVDRFIWCGDTVLSAHDAYQSRQRHVCLVCGKTRPFEGESVKGETDAGTLLYDGGACPYCGAEKWGSVPQRMQTVPAALHTVHGTVPGGGQIPYYVPDRYPIVLQKSVSVYGKLLGNSDVDVIADQQNTVNRMEKKIIDRITKAGTRITMPPKTSVTTDPNDQEIIYLEDAAQKSMIGTLDFTGNLQYEMAYLAQVYEEARQMLGITDAYQGRQDASAVSGVAKQFAAAQSAGRLESRRVMKNCAYAHLFELMFRFKLAYEDEPIPVFWKNSRGETEYGEFSRYDFLKTDDAGNYCWNDAFLFSVDTTDSLAANREQMWQANKELLASGAFGDPGAVDTLILFWSKMEALHYPTASETKSYLEEKAARERETVRGNAEGGMLI